MKISSHKKLTPVLKSKLNSCKNTVMYESFTGPRMWATQMPSQLLQNQQNADKTSQANNRALGMTSAISVAGPKSVDIQRTTELQEALKPYNVQESDQELNHRLVGYNQDDIFLTYSSIQISLECNYIPVYYIRKLLANLILLSHKIV